MSEPPPSARPGRDYAAVTGAYWAFTLTDGALRTLVLLHLHALGFAPLAIASMFLVYEALGLVTNLVGGWVGALSDHVVSICMFSALENDEHFTTQDLQIKLFRPVSGAVVRIEAEVVNRSKSTGYVEAKWMLEDGKIAVKVLAWKAIRSREALARA